MLTILPTQNNTKLLENDMKTLLVGESAIPYAPPNNSLPWSSSTQRTSNTGGQYGTHNIYGDSSRFGQHHAHMTNYYY